MIVSSMTKYQLHTSENACICRTFHTSLCLTAAHRPLSNTGTHVSTCTQARILAVLRRGDSDMGICTAPQFSAPDTNPST